MRPLVACLIPSTVLCLVSCSTGASPLDPSAFDDAKPASPGMSQSADGIAMGTAARFRATIDAGSLQADVTLLSGREAAANDDLYLLPVGQFFARSDFQIDRVARTADELIVDYTLHHPFPAPSDPTAPASAANRADLGFAGMLLLLADVESATGHSFIIDTVVNTDLVTNADAYYRPRGLINPGTTANTFPYRRVVDETGTGNRVGISNGNTPTGNYGTDGWTRAELGPDGTGWTGYGVLHQGQSATNTWRLRLSALPVGASITLDFALIAKYNDPRGGSTLEARLANRLPPAVPDASKFAYRMPHGALDVEAIEVVEIDDRFFANEWSTADLFFRVVDWDARSGVTGEADLGTDFNIGFVAQGAAGAPTLAVCIPGVIGNSWFINSFAPGNLDNNDSFHGGDPEPDMGQPGDALYYWKTMPKDSGVGEIPGTYVGLVRAHDVESGLGDYVFPLDASLAPVTLPPQNDTYQRFEVTLRPPRSDTWGASLLTSSTTSQHQVTTDSAGNTLAIGTYEGMIDLNPGQEADQRTAEVPGNTYLVKLAPNGAYRWAVTLAGATFLGVATDAQRNVYLCGPWDGTVDFDPGPGVQMRSGGGGFMLSLSPSGAFRGVATWGSGYNMGPARVVCNAQGQPRVVGVFLDTVDFDPGPGIAERTAEFQWTPFCVALDALGAFQWASVWTASSAGQQLFPWGLGIDSTDGVLIGSLWEWTGDFDPGPGSVEFTAVDGADAYGMRLKPDGSLDWVAPVGGTGDEIAHGIADISGGRTAFAGRFAGTIDVDPGVGVIERTSAGSTGFIVAVDDTGAYAWDGILDGGFLTQINDVASAQNGGVLLTGSYASQVDFDPGPDQVLRTAAGADEVFLLSLGGSGTFQWVNIYENATLGMGVTSADDGSIRLLATIEDYADFDPGPDYQYRDERVPSPYVLRLKADGTR